MKEIGKVHNYYDHIGVIAVKLTGGLKVGDRIKVEGATTNFEQEVKSMQMEHKEVKSAKAKDDVGIKAESECKKGDKIIKL